MRTLAPPVAEERPTPHPRAPARRAALLALLPALLLTLPATAEPPADAYAAQRHALVDALREEHDPRLSAQALAVMEQVPRHVFVPEDQRDEAYENRPLGIGFGQTISQPYIVALMTSLARPARDQRILEIGTGSGYQAAVLGAFGAQVYSVEIIEPLARAAAPRLQAWPNVHTRVGDGYYGWPEHAPFDAIVVTAGADSIPPPLVRQLASGGRLVMPVGSPWADQRLVLLEKDSSGQVASHDLLPVRFVPLLRGER